MDIDQRKYTSTSFTSSHNCDTCRIGKSSIFTSGIAVSNLDLKSCVLSAKNSPIKSEVASKSLQ
jgi:hypothetical protein